MPQFSIHLSTDGHLDQMCAFPIDTTETQRSIKDCYEQLNSNKSEKL
jgi:hypothetical protein